MPEKSQLYIREWGRIVCAEKEPQQVGINEIRISKSAWQELEKYADSSKQKYIDFKNSTTLRIKNYVGVITTKDGTQIEILPKTSEKAPNLSDSRKLIWKMLNKIYKVGWIDTLDADLVTKKQNLHELLIYRFLLSIKAIVKKGIRSDYHRIEAHEKFLKGQLQLPKQVNEPPHRQYLFHIEYDVFSPNRAENRLIHSALLQVGRYSKEMGNKKLARKLLVFFDEVPNTQPNQYKTDFKKWHNHAKDRSMHYYQNALPWVKLILDQQNPFTQKGANSGISFLLPMEELFEKYVAAVLRENLPKGYQLTEQSTKHHLATNATGKKVFQLKPDMVISKDGKFISVLDTKWKLINENATYENGNIDKKKDISQADMYQLFAYGKKYNVKKVVLIYPAWEKFTKKFDFELETDLHLGVVPFSFDKDIIITKNSPISQRQPNPSQSDISLVEAFIRQTTHPV